MLIKNEDQFSPTLNLNFIQDFETAFKFTKAPSEASSTTLKTEDTPPSHHPRKFLSPFKMNRQKEDGIQQDDGETGESQLNSPPTDAATPDHGSCYLCGDYGHVEWDCARAADLPCINCTERGHKLKNCPKPVSLEYAQIYGHLADQHRIRDPILVGEGGAHVSCFYCHVDGHLTFSCPFPVWEGIATEIIFVDQLDDEHGVVVEKAEQTDFHEPHVLTPVLPELPSWFPDSITKMLENPSCPKTISQKDVIHLARYRIFLQKRQLSSYNAYRRAATKALNSYLAIRKARFLDLKTLRKRQHREHREDTVRALVDLKIITEPLEYIDEVISFANRD